MPEINRYLAKTLVKGPRQRGSTQGLGCPGSGPGPQRRAHTSTHVSLHPPANVPTAACSRIKGMLVQPSATQIINLKATAVLPDEGRGSSDRSCPEAVWACEGWVDHSRSPNRLTVFPASSSFSFPGGGCST